MVPFNLFLWVLHYVSEKKRQGKKKKSGAERDKEMKNKMFFVSSPQNGPDTQLTRTTRRNKLITS